MRMASLAKLGIASLAIVLLASNDRQGDGMLPGRLLACSVGHVTNFDPSREQTAAELRFDGFHPFSLFLPAIRVLKGAPPDASEAAPPVDPRTRILSDPDHISGQPNPSFGRIVDLWPDRVELSATIAGPLLNTIVITPIDPVHGTANLFMMRATELTHFDATHIYQGICHVTVEQTASTAPKAPG
jgi:hypothetical protein